MKKHLFSGVLLSVFCLVFFSGAYTALVWGMGQLTPDRGNARQITAGGRTYYRNIAQRFTDDQYFWSRPSAVAYNAAGSGGSNKGPSNPEYLQTVSDRIDTFLVHNPGVPKDSIPSDLVTASGSGLDPHISVQAARVQVVRVARARGMAPEAVQRLVRDAARSEFGGIGPVCINVLALNLALDGLNAH